jgi:putative flippase GtrA
MSRPKKKNKKEATRILEYLVSGGVWFWSGYILIVLLDDVIGLFAANFIGNAVGITLNFLLQRYWVFRTKRPEKIAFTAGRYIVYTMLNAFILNFLILYFLREYAGIKPEIGQFIASAFFTIWNYIWYKVWVFPVGSPHRAKVVRPKLRTAHKHLVSAHH